ncbi:MAG: NfeD family protein, partial [Spirochaetota bacterium]|nr:NfeD family protein [Spirochaetota bacterium]
AINVLPINFAGIVLLALGIVLFILELNIVSYGLLTLGGIASFILGGLILFDSPLPGFQIPLTSIIIVVLLILAFFYVILRSVVLVHKGKVSTGLEGIIGETGTAIEDFKKTGKALVHGEIWNAQSDDEIKKHDPVIVVSAKGMILFVKKGNQ